MRLKEPVYLLFLRKKQRWSVFTFTYRKCVLEISKFNGIFQKLVDRSVGDK